MATNTLGNQARQQHTQVVNTFRKTVNYNDPGISAGVRGFTLPLGAFIVQVLCEIVTVFNAGTTNVLTVGTNGPTNYNDIIAAGDVNEAALAVTSVTTGLGRSLAAAAAKDVFFKYTQSGTAATTGQAVIVISYEGNTN